MNVKNRLISVITAFCCICSSFVGGCAASENASDPQSETVSENAGSDIPAAVKNDFEVNYDGWCPSSHSVKLAAEDGMGCENSRGMVVSGREKASDGVYSVKGMYLSGNTDYTYSVMVYSDTAETFHFGVACSTRFSNTENSNELVKVTAEAGKWTELKADFTAPEGSKTFKLTITAESNADFRFDNVTVTPKNPVEAPAEEKGLKDEFADYFRVGNILNGGSVKDHDILANILKNYNSITCENELKPDSVLVQSQCEGDNIGVSIDKAAPILDFCVNNNIALRGHVLVWHSQTPVWFFKDNYKKDGEWVTPDVMDKRMESYIKNLFETIKTQYPSLDLYAYDVVNEAVSDDSKRGILYGGAREPGDNNVSNGQSAWVQVYGDNSFIEKAFVYARKYAPEGTKLFYNDYNEYWDHKRDKIYEMCKNLYEKGLLDGVGMQSHVNADINGFSGAGAHKTAMEKYLSIGCEVQITEFDINCEGGKFTPEQQAEKVTAIVKAAMDYNSSPNYDGRVTAVCFWGPNDANTWINAENAPLLYDTNNEPKAAYNALTEMIPADKWGDGKNPVKYETAKKEINLDKTELDEVTSVIGES